MYLPVIISLPILVCLWIYFLIILRNIFLPPTSIHLNFIESPGNISSVIKNLAENNPVVKNDSSVKKRKKIHVPKFMLELYEKNKIGRTDDGKSPDVVRSLIPTHAEPFQGNEVIEDPAENHLLIFNIPTADEDEKFVRAELKILTLLSLDARSEIGVRRILKLSIYDDSVKHLLDFQEIQIHHFNNSWISFDVTAPVNDILRKNPKSKYLKIVVTVSTFVPQVKDHLKLSLMPVEEDFEHDYPVLLLSYSSSKNGEKDVKEEKAKKITLQKSRQKRSVEDDYEEETNKIWDDDVFSRKTVQMKKLKRMRNACKKKPLYVDFKEINYDSWIVQPSGYEAYQCQGRCFYPVAEHLNPTKHAIVQALLHSVAPTKVTRSCCVPTVLGSISILYVDTNGVLTYRYAYNDMVVAECGCR
ncbi:bone morphogenetic protein 10-like [Diabrotica undecimpunctata]|uniref:bone morphogenetic protein 10-like n=1 Tax=Diabrotica undecimpunctata TaxID=50387 RepID=UPI003B6394F8